jgi:hypothetical protein
MKTLSFTLLSLSLLACGGAAPAEAEADIDLASGSEDQTEVASIHFQSDWDEEVSGKLTAGQQLTVKYDDARLPKCRGSKYGMPAWSITGFYRLNGGAIGTFNAAGHNPDGSHPPVVIDLPAAGDLELWFQSSSAFGCSEYDSNFGDHYHFTVARPASAPEWVGNGAYALSRWTCDDGRACPADLKSLEGSGFVYDTWARQRAAVAHLYFEVWKPGVTDFDNPDLWKQLDVQIRYRYVPGQPFQSSYVPFDQRVGNNARYASWIRQLDPLGGNTITDKAKCPYPLWPTDDGQYVYKDFEYYFVVSGVELRPSEGGTFKGKFLDYRGLYDVCLN